MGFYTDSSLSVLIRDWVVYRQISPGYEHLAARFKNNFILKILFKIKLFPIKRLFMDVIESYNKDFVAALTGRLGGESR